MTFRIHVVGLGAQRPAAEFHDLLSRCPVFARSSAPAVGWLGDAYPLADSFDDVFERGPASRIGPAIVERLSEAAEQADECVYLVPGAGQIGDTTVELLARHLAISITSGVLDIDVPLGDAQIIDALCLAEAEEAFPFDAGLAAPDPARTVVVTNLCGEMVRAPALRRLRRVFPHNHRLEKLPGDSATLVIQPSAEPAAIRSYLGLEQIVATLRSPDGCPWDREQSVESLIPMMLEEIEEFRDAWQTRGAGDQADELGDVLLHISMIAQIARERHGFGMEDVLEAITGKMVRRHPHVFGDVEVGSIDELYDVWQRVKDSERSGDAPGPHETVSGGK